jgi:2'-5' RNA ligase
MRAFIACDMFHPAFESIIQELKKSEANIKFVEPENTHITLKFLGEIDEERANRAGEIVEKIFSGAFPLEAKLSGVGVFPGLNYMCVIWVGVTCSHLEKLQHNLDDAFLELGFKKEKNFKLHLTIGRVKSAKNKQNLLDSLEKVKNTEIGVIKIESVKLKKSELTPKGPFYTDLKVVT